MWVMQVGEEASDLEVSGSNHLTSPHCSWDKSKFVTIASVWALAHFASLLPPLVLPLNIQPHQPTCQPPYAMLSLGHWHFHMLFHLPSTLFPALHLFISYCRCHFFWEDFPAFTPGWFRASALCFCVTPSASAPHFALPLICFSY